MHYAVRVPKWEAYKLLDFGEGWRWERWGSYTVQRPDSWAVGAPQTPRSRWKPAHVYQPTDSYAGEWHPPLPEKWPISYREKWELRLWARAGRFKHLGFFPEQAVHWEWLYSWLKAHPGARVLNLFGYTGAASITAALAGGGVTHVDSSKSALTWAAENAQLNGVHSIRWIPEDARRFVQRAVRRGEKYQVILLDPPAYGIGTQGRRWQLESDLPALLAELRTLLHPETGAFLLNVYSTGFSPLTLYRLGGELCGLPTAPEVGELALSTPQGRLLSTGIYLRATW